MRPDEPVGDAMAGVCGSSGPECSGRTACRREAVAPECVWATVSQFCSSDTSLAASLAASPRLYEALHALRPAVACRQAADTGSVSLSRLIKLAVM